VAESSDHTDIQSVRQSTISNGIGPFRQSTPAMALNIEVDKPEQGRPLGQGLSNATPLSQLKSSQSHQVIPSVKIPVRKTLIPKKKRVVKIKDQRETHIDNKLAHASDLMTGSSIKSLYMLAPSIGDRNNKSFLKNWLPS